MSPKGEQTTFSRGQSLSSRGLAGPSLVTLGLSVAIMLLNIGVIFLFVSNRLPLREALVLVGVPWAGLVASLKPEWLLPTLIAVPAQLTTSIPSKLLSVMVAVAMAGLVFVRGRLFRGLWSPLSALAGLAVAGHFYQAEVAPEATLINQTLVQNLLLYVLLALLAFNLGRFGDLSADQVGNAYLAGTVSTLIIALSGYEGGWFASGTAAFSRSFFGYLAVGSLGVCLGRYFLKSRPIKGEARNAVYLVAFLSMTLISFVRTAWLSGLATFFLLADRLGKRRYFLVLVLLLISVWWVPAVRQELTSTRTGEVQEAVEGGTFASGRWELWSELWDRATPALPWGNGFGYAWSLSSEDIFGFEGAFASRGNETVYPHNDFLYILLEFGIPGVVLMALFWMGLLRAVLRLSRNEDEPLRKSTLILAGIIVTGLLVTLFDNLLAIRPIAERFFPIAGLVLGVAAAERHHGSHRSLKRAAWMEDI